MFFGTGAYTSTILQVTYGWNPWLAWPAAMLAGGIVGWVIAFLSFRAGLRGSYFALITLASPRSSASSPTRCPSPAAGSAC